jgi:hypothetical protein
MVNRDLAWQWPSKAGGIRKLAGVGGARVPRPCPPYRSDVLTPAERPQIYQISLIRLLLIWPRAIGLMALV